MLFSEPKIPQSTARRATSRSSSSFSALQRAENSSIPNLRRERCDGIGFQCSSASRKFLNSGLMMSATDGRRRFQCSSASRKFLNRADFRQKPTLFVFQCSSASRKFLNRRAFARRARRRIVSVLFSEPKIPQSPFNRAARAQSSCFSALQRAENSSMRSPTVTIRNCASVSVLFSEPKIPQ